MTYKTKDVRTAAGLMIVFEFDDMPGKSVAMSVKGFASGVEMLAAARELIKAQ